MLKFRFFCLICLIPNSCQDISGSESALLNKILENYDKRFPPPGKKPVIVQTAMYIRAIETISTSDMQLTAQLTYRRMYSDPRLAFRNESGLDYITLRDPYVIWTPDSFFVNSLGQETHNQLARIYPNGDVYLSERISVTLYCPMNLVNYPFDRQICQIKIGSCK